MFQKLDTHVSNLSLFTGVLISASAFVYRCTQPPEMSAKNRKNSFDHYTHPCQEARVRLPGTIPPRGIGFVFSWPIERKNRHNSFSVSDFAFTRPSPNWVCL